MSITTYDQDDPYQMYKAVASWFIGPQVENEPRLQQYFEKAIACMKQARLNYHPEDGPAIDQETINSDVYQAAAAKFDSTLAEISQLLMDHCVPFSSPRYAGHMCFETSMPAITGWVHAIMFNQNNVAFEASPITTVFENMVGQDLCQMLGFPNNSWGHLTSGGTVANMESMWAARNLQFYPLTLRAAMQSGQPLDFAATTFMVATCDQPDQPKLFADLTVWELLNLTVDTVLSMAEELNKQCGVSPEYLAEATKPFDIQTVGKDRLMQMFNVPEPKYFISSTKHYSWPKAAALTGIGSENVVNVPVDNDARINVDDLEQKLEACLANQVPVYAVVAIIGTTEEGAVDPLDRIIELRNGFQQRGLSFVVHADAAWGGYFASMIREAPSGPLDRDVDPIPEFMLRDYTMNQFKALKDTDSITIDPHKSGYIPYPGGALCYRDGRMRYLLTWSAPYLDSGDTALSIGTYGLEGSKPGAPSVATLLHHTAVGLHMRGHGALLGQVIWTSSRLSAVWATLATAQDDFILVPFNDPGDPQQIRDLIIGRTNQAIYEDDSARALLRGLGSDLNINAFCLNFKLNGNINDDVEEANYLNKALYQALAILTPNETIYEKPMFLSATTFEMESYGDCCTNYKKRLQLEIDSMQDLFVLRNVCMSPFQTVGDFVSKLGDIFKEAVEAQLQGVVERNTVEPAEHAFLVQQSAPDSRNIYMVYLPRYHNANSRAQLILSAQRAVTGTDTLPTAAPWGDYPLFFVNNTTIADILTPGVTISGTIEHGTTRDTVTLTNLTVVRQLSLRSDVRPRAYPDLLPFYLYGTPDAAYIDHQLSRAPNVQISSPAPVTLALTPALAVADLQTGVFAVCQDARERACQPPSGATQGLVQPDALVFQVKVYRTDDASGAVLAQGTVTLAGWPWVWLGLNAGASPPAAGGKDMAVVGIRDLLQAVPPVAGGTVGGASATAAALPTNAWFEYVAGKLGRA